jgi:uncharacterized protein
MALKIVLDTNCVVSALLFSKQSLAWLRFAWQSGQFQPVVCKETVTELMRVLSYPKFKLTAAEQALLLADFLPYTQTQAAFDNPPNLPIVRDESDQIFLALAFVSNADVLVTGDNDLLALKQSFNKPPIMTLADFELWLKENHPA